MTHRSWRPRKLAATIASSLVLIVAVTACDPVGTGSAGGTTTVPPVTTTTTEPTGPTGPTDTPVTTDPPITTDPNQPTEQFDPIDPDTPSDWAPPEPLTTKVVPRPETVVAEPGTVLSITGDPTTSQVVVLAPDQRVPEIGGFLAVDIDQDNPLGALGRVVAINQTPGGATAVTIEPALLDEAYEVFQVNSTYSMADAVQFESGAGGDGATPEPESRRGPAIPASLNKLMDTSMFQCDGDKTGLTLSNELTLADLRVTIQFDMASRYFRTVVDLEPKAVLKLEVAGVLSCKVKPERMPRVRIPIAAVFGVNFKPVVSFSFKAGLDVTATNSVIASEGVEFSNGRSRSVHRAPIWETSIDFALAGKASTFVGLSGAFDMGGRATAGIEVGPEISFEVNTTGLCLDTSGGVKVGGVLDLDLVLFRWHQELTLLRLGDRLLVTRCSDDPTGPPTTSAPVTTTPPTTTPPLGVLVPGSLTNLRIDQNLRCSVISPTDGRSVYYGGNSCGTAVFVNGTTYGATGSAFTPVSGPTSTGDGSGGNPQIIRTTVAAGDTGVQIEQIDTFVEGSGSYNTTINVRNTLAEPVDVKLYRAADCYLGQSDYGTGQISSDSVSCVANNNRRISWTDLTGGASRQEGHYWTIWSVLGAGSMFDNTIANSNLDNGAGLSWQLTIPGSASTPIRSRFSLDEPEGIGQSARRGQMDDGSQDPPKPQFG